MITNPIYIDKSSGSGGYENDWDPRNMKEDVMLDLSNYSSNILHIGGNGRIYESDGSTIHTFDTSKHLIIATYGNNITIEFKISETNDLAFIVSSSTSNIQYFKIKLPQEANGKHLVCSGNSGNIKAIYLEN